VDRDRVEGYDHPDVERIGMMIGIVIAAALWLFLIVAVGSLPQ
jgi:hypothetical protein